MVALITYYAITFKGYSPSSGDESEKDNESVPPSDTARYIYIFHFYAWGCLNE